MSLPKLSCAPCAFGRRWLGVLTLVLVLGAGPVFAAGPLQVQVLENAADRIVLDYDLTGFGQQAVTIDGEKHSLITLGRESVLQVAGAPALPHVCRSVIVPDDAEMAEGAPCWTGVGGVVVSKDCVHEPPGSDVAPQGSSFQRNSRQKKRWNTPNAG